MTGPVTRTVAAIGRTGWILSRSARGVAADAIDQDRLARDRLAAAFERLGWRPIPILALLGLMIGVACGTAASRVLQALYAERLVEPLVSHVLARDVAPLLVGVFAAGRIAVETAVRLGAMRLSAELDALRITGHEPVRFVVAPALGAVVMSTPIQLAIVFGCAWLGFAGVLHLTVNVAMQSVAHNALDADTFRFLLAGLVKAMLYNVGALAIGALTGLSNARGIAAIGREATQAFTGGLLLVIAIGVLSVLLQ